VLSWRGNFGYKPMRYNWEKLNNLQKGSFGEHYAKMEFAMYGLLVFTAEVDDRGIDFVARNNEGLHFDVQVKTITGRNYTFISESKFYENLVVSLVVLNQLSPPEIYLFRKDDWSNEKHKDALLTHRKYPNAKEPEYGVNITKAREPLLQDFLFEKRI
jgi:hypothetical protein